MRRRTAAWKIPLFTAVVLSGFALWNFKSIPVAKSAPADPVESIRFPLKQDSVKFAIIGDSGTGDAAQNQVAAQMLKTRAAIPFSFVLMMGDNIYGGHSAADLKKKFADPYKALMDSEVKFYASLGNHDNANERFYEPFNMGGKRFYNFRRGNVEFFALDSNYMDPAQLDWLNKGLSGSNAPWKICYFHHPLYTNARYHGPDADLRQQLEPIFEKYNVSVVMSGHEHVYERLQPQKGIYYFVLGNSGELRYHNLRPSPQTIRGFDTDQSFAVFEVVDDDLYFEAISRTGVVVDAGV